MSPEAQGMNGTPVPKRRRRRFSLNALAIQLSAFALSFTLVALLVVTGSHAAFVEPVESGTPWVAPPSPVPSPDPVPPTRPRPPAPPAPEEPVPEPAEEEPLPEPPVEEPVEVQLSDSRAGTAMFTDGTPLSPGTARARCLDVSYSGDADPGPVMLYAAATSGALAPHLQLSVELGTSSAGTSGSCADFAPSGALYTGTVAGFAAAHPEYSTGLQTWDPPEGGNSRAFRFTVSVSDDPAAMGQSASFGFSWETRGQ
jgi:hypothetical protein